MHMDRPSSYVATLLGISMDLFYASALPVLLSSFAVSLFRASIDAVATPKAPVETDNAPLTPSFLILRKTVTTKAFRGIPNRFIITDR